MIKERSFLPGFSFWQRILRLAIFIYFLLLVRGEIALLAAWLNGVFQKGFDPKSLPMRPVLILSVWVLLFFSIYLFQTFSFAQFILPVKTWPDRFRAFERLLRFGISRGRWHGPAVFIQNGERIGTYQELEKHGPGVAFVDLRSAITLDKRTGKKKKLSPASLEYPENTHYIGRDDPYKSKVRTFGPGLVFTGKGEKIHGTVDLRIQSRSRKEVLADTKDGIQVKTDVSCTFTIGQPPDILDVCLCGENGDRIMVIEWDDLSSTGEKRIKGFSDELDERDEEEIRTFILSHPDPSKVISDVPSGHFPYAFDPYRVEKAVYSETSVQDPAIASRPPFKKWSDWPQDVAAEKFRILLAQWPYLNLYTPDDPKKYPMKDFKRKLSQEVRNTGILAYRVIALRDDSQLQIGKNYYTRDLIFFPSRNLNRSDVLRDRGIKVLSTGIGELEPQKQDVRDRMRNSWKSAKQREADMKYADHSLEVARVTNQARIRTQQNMIYHLAKILENQEHPREALAMLIYQELEAAAANPETRKLLSEDTLSVLTWIGTTLLQKEGGSSNGESPNLPGDHIDQ